MSANRKISAEKLAAKEETLHATTNGNTAPPAFDQPPSGSTTPPLPVNCQPVIQPTARAYQPEVDLSTLSLDELSTSEQVYNRELSWLDFNWRVLAEALDARTPLLERLKFIAITASNLDEFFRKRVGGLKRQQAAGIANLTLTQCPDCGLCIAQ